ncbi:diamine N-acetyltransferase [Paenibacillus uliginis N3/975]|uniref:Diamine N-acetyltransferase n=1 Tax=Paenibacillus uliginis N3/975 TaxID=1313296 RepID=A0A1X7H570_9BACL|nr:GNAT family N-acetyltransferase [Paenibacillus uliginis]SMF79531.1 diamine N-acetyltransferase [Paenibacillus uliginis N3/975]
MISLRKIDRSNWEECIHLRVREEQERFMASNLYSIAEVQFLPGFMTRAIILDDKVIGFLMYGIDPDDQNYWIYRFMIDDQFQGKGYGRAAMNLLIQQIEAADNRTEVIMIGYNSDNEGARRLYKSVGFEEIGLAPWGEELARYTYK